MFCRSISFGGWTHVSQHWSRAGFDHYRRVRGVADSRAFYFLHFWEEDSGKVEVVQGICIRLEYMVCVVIDLLIHAPYVQHLIHFWCSWLS